MSPGHVVWREQTRDAVRGRALGTNISVTVTDPVMLDPARRAVTEVVDQIDLACSRFTADSELSRLNRRAGRATLVTPLLFRVIDEALEAARITDGAVDPTLGASMEALGYDADFEVVRRRPAGAAQPYVTSPGRWQEVRLDPPDCVMLPAGVDLDLGATAKGLAADLAAEKASTAILGGVLVSIGGDMAMAGRPPTGGWRVHITDDSNQASREGDEMFTLRSGAVASSSTTVRRWVRGGRHMHHILDPRTGLPATGEYVLVTVAGPRCVLANTATTAAIVRGRGIVPWLQTMNLPARIVDSAGRVTRLNGWPEAQA
jgi:thiamine biosynthesis lipoprotein ApbE